jgi:hypothetical protein
MVIIFPLISGVPSWFFLLVSLALSLAIVVPLTGALVRFRANYNPKGLQLDAEGDVQPHTGPVISSFFGMLRRVYRIEVRVLSKFHKATMSNLICHRDGRGFTKD